MESFFSMPVVLIVSLVMILSSVLMFGAHSKHGKDKYGYSEGVVTVDEGVDLNYFIEGKGIPCMVIGLAQYYPPVISQELRKHFKFVFVEHRGLAPGLTNEQSEQVTLDTLMDDMEKVRAALGFDKVAVMGHSIHGLFALHYASKYPQHTSHCIVSGIFPVGCAVGFKEADAFWEADASDERKELFAANMQQLAIDVEGKTPSEMMILEYVASAPKYWYDPHFDCSHFWEGVGEVNVDLVMRLYSDIFSHYDIHRDMKTLTAPVFVAMGRYDYSIPHYLWDDVVPKYPQISFHLFEKSGHTPFYEEQKLFDKLLLKWVKNYGKK